MALLEIKVNMSLIASYLLRIAEALERAYPIRLQVEPKPATFLNIDPGFIAEAEEEADRKREAGTEGA